MEMSLHLLQLLTKMPLLHKQLGQHPLERGFQASPQEKLLHLLVDFLAIQPNQQFAHHQVASVGLRVRHVLQRVGGKLLAQCYSSFLKNYLQFLPSKALQIIWTAKFY